jgi:carbon starvation protein
LGRYIIQELLHWPSRAGAAFGTLITMALPAYFLTVSEEGSYIKFWTLFGASNQLLAGLTLLSITVWLYRSRRRVWFTLLPMMFVLTITLWSLIRLTISNLRDSAGVDVKMFNALSALVLVLLALYLTLTALVKVRVERRTMLAPEAA